MKSMPKLLPLVFLFALLTAGCGGQVTPTESVNTVAPTVVAASATPQPSATPSATPTASLTPTPEPTATPTPPVQVEVNTATNCREGPAPSFPFSGVLEPGRSTTILALAEGLDYYYIENPDASGEPCWLWGEYASVTGEVSELPRLTPAPSPTPQVGFDLYVHSFQQCGGDTRLVAIVENSGASRLMTAEWGVFDIDAGDWLRPIRFERHPFAETSQSCPPGHGNRLDPGAGAFLIMSLGSPPAGHLAYASVKLCTGDFLAGDCLTKELYFTLP